MRIAELCRALAADPEPPAGAAAPVDDELLERSVRYLASDEAARSVERDPYWPKWDSPWWHMLLLHELGEARRIPDAIAARMIDAMNGLPMHTFPVRPEERPTGTDAYRAYACHCALGCLHQVLTARGVDVSRALPWVEPWFPRYQMADGGANCDEAAYTSGEVASSMVGTIATLEAMLADGGEFVDRAAGFLIERRLTEGSASRHNAEERAAAPGWLLPAFPRFYFYDVLRGLAALVRWAELHERVVPVSALSGAAVHLARAFPDGVVTVQRRAIDLHSHTLAFVDGEWARAPTTSFPLLDAVAVIGRPCPYLTRQWTVTRRTLLELCDAGRITEA
jgi:hypothetical protein